MKNETARREIESLDYYLQNHTDDYSEESHTAMMMAIDALNKADVLEQITAEIYEEFMTIDGGVHDVSAIKCMEIIDKYREEQTDAT